MQVILFGHDAILAQILRDDRRRYAVWLISARVAIESRRQQSELGGIGDRKPSLGLSKTMPRGAGGQFPELRMARQLIGRHALPGNVVRRALTGGVGDRNAVRHERIVPALLNDRGTEWPLVAPGFGVLDQRIVADLF